MLAGRALRLVIGRIISEAGEALTTRKFLRSHDLDIAFGALTLATS